MYVFKYSKYIARKCSIKLQKYCKVLHIIVQKHMLDLQDYPVDSVIL